MAEGQGPRRPWWLKDSAYVLAFAALLWRGIGLYYEFKAHLVEDAKHEKVVNARIARLEKHDDLEAPIVVEEDQ